LKEVGKKARRRKRKKRKKKFAGVWTPPFKLYRVCNRDHFIPRVVWHHARGIEGVPKTKRQSQIVREKGYFPMEKVRRR
jgi:hypothetical protein